MTYHESRMPLGVSEGVLSPLTPEELAAAGIKASDFGPANWKAAQGPDGKQYAVPLDIHSIILYYNKDLLKKAGLLGDDGKPKGLDGVANFDAALAKLTANGVSGLSVPNDGGSGWRIFYTLFNQQGGEFLKDGKFLDGDNLDKATTALAEMQKWIKNGWAPTNTEYPASIALFTSGKAAMHINGVWEVPTMVDLAKKGQLFDWGAIQIPVLYLPAGDLGGFALFRHPRPQGQPGRARKAQARARRHPLVQPALARMGWRRPYPRLSAGAGKRGVQGAEAELGLCLARQDGRLRPGVDLRWRRLARLRRGGQLHDSRDERRDRACRRGQEDSRRSAGPDEIDRMIRAAPRSGRLLRPAGADRAEREASRRDDQEAGAANI